MAVLNPCAEKRQFKYISMDMYLQYTSTFSVDPTAGICFSVPLAATVVHAGPPYLLIFIKVVWEVLGGVFSVGG